MFTQTLCYFLNKVFSWFGIPFSNATAKIFMLCFELGTLRSKTWKIQESQGPLVQCQKLLESTQLNACRYA